MSQAPGVSVGTPGAADLARIEAYYDAVPRAACTVEPFGALVLFRRNGPGWPYYARPAPGWTGPVPVGDVAAVRARQRELGLPESFEWVHEATPGLAGAARAAGLMVNEHPLMVADPGWDGPSPRIPDGYTVRLVGPDDPGLPAALAVADLAFATPGTGVGPVGPAELAQAVRARAADAATVTTVAWLRAGRAVLAAAFRGDRPGSAGRHQPLGTVSEIVGVGTLPSLRRQGLAAAVTARLLADARQHGVELLFLSAGDEAVARIYARLGCRRVATAMIAEPAAGPA